MPKKIVTVSRSGVGDLLLAIPTYRALREKNPESKIIVFLSDKRHCRIIKHMPYVDSVRSLKFWSLIRYPYYLLGFLFAPKRIAHTLMEFQHIPFSWAYCKNVRGIIPEIFDIHLKSSKIELFFTQKEERKARKALLPYKYPVIMHIHSGSSANHLWPMINWVELVRTFAEVTFIQVGYQDEPYVAGAVDWRGKTRLMEAFCLLKYATSFVGVDSIFSHATAAFDLRGVVLFGDTSPIHLGHENNINIYKGVDCSPCYYDLWGAACPYKHECMNLISVEEVKMALLRQITRVKEA